MKIDYDKWIKFIEDNASYYSFNFITETNTRYILMNLRKIKNGSGQIVTKVAIRTRTKCYCVIILCEKDKDDKFSQNLYIKLRRYFIRKLHEELPKEYLEYLISD